ncbi:3-hydroxybutyryl-CoA dehydrogenase [Breoghania corrubedonensis]|uniref:3-hydroxybutyryl-CoA dehydrogenase n=1 Tax=Breoghania corrubedonensis TaxID=665038 RepID=A0A2T5US83_9HYPH|nr:3-hydroxyacyl-CoA dehydrogenase family protein [Breoghania corrubedonensis]PTW54375.1 3-hydroxybutyryl-CoA dehydrogenase [Breoghania corrubedonensis]
MIKKIAVIGAGTMGHGIAETFALYGYSVNLFDVNTEVLNKAKELIREELSFMAAEEYISAADVEATLERIETSTDMAKAVEDRDFVIEAAPEKMELKQQLLKSLDELAPKDAFLATNTSSLPFAEMCALLGEDRKKRTMVNHWYNPAHLMPLVELSFFGNMPKELYEEVATLYASVEKQTAKVLKDVPGLIANRIQQGVAREAFSLIEKGIAEPSDIDIALKFGPAFRYATTGQLEVADFGGLDIWCVVGDNLLKVMDNSTEANPMLREKVSEGKLGLKSGEGFFKYPPEEVAAIRNKFMGRLIHQLKASRKYI